MRIPANLYGNAAILHALMFRQEGITEAKAPKELTFRFIAVLGLSGYDFPTLELVEENGYCAIDGLAIWEIQDFFRNVGDRIENEVKTVSGYNGAILQLVRMVNTNRRRGFPLTSGCEMQLRNLLLTNHIDLKTDGFWEAKDPKYEAFLHRFKANMVEEERKLLDGLKSMNFE